MGEAVKKYDWFDLYEHQRMFRVVLWAENFEGIKIKTIRRKTLVLCQYLFGDEYTYAKVGKKKYLVSRTRERICDELVFNYISREHYLKYDPQCALSTWVVDYIYKNINNLLRKYRPRALDERIDARTDILDDKNKNFRASYEDYLAFSNIATSMDDPEGVLVAKDLLGMVLAFFGEADTMVLLGMVDREEVAEAQGISYDLYSKRLNHRRELFEELLERLGYFDK